VRDPGPGQDENADGALLDDRRDPDDRQARLPIDTDRCLARDADGHATGHHGLDRGGVPDSPLAGVDHEPRTPGDARSVCDVAARARRLVVPRELNGDSLA
jgi:hypothetical protein